MTLLETKFNPPPLPPHVIPRDRLLQPFGDTSRLRLGALIAPAGFGKTTVAQQWLEKSGVDYAWWSLDRMDNSPARFLTYFIALLERATGLNLPEIRPEAETESLLPAMTTLINQLEADMEEPAVLVLDDFHCVNHPKILEAIAYWVDYAPRGCLLCLTARSEPALPLPRWKVKRFARVLYAADLLFSPEETMAYCQERGIASPSGEFLAALQNQTSGWIAALHLALDRGAAATEDASSSGLPREFQTDLSEYMAAEVFSELEEELQEFILDVYPLRRFDAALCDRIRGREDSQRFIQTLLQRDLFVIALDEQRSWVKLHALFRDAAALTLHQSGLSEPDLSLIATALTERGMHLDALELLLEEQDWRPLASCLLTTGNALIRQGFHLNLLDFLNRLPEEAMRQFPRLLLLQAWSLVYDNRFSALPELIKRARLLFADQTDTDVAVRVELKLLDAYVERQSLRFDKAIDLTRSVISQLDAADVPLKSLAYFNLGTDLYRQGEISEACEMLRHAINQGKLEQRFSTVLSSLGLLVWIYQLKGHFVEGINQYRSIQTWAASFHPEGETPDVISCWLNSALVMIHTAQGKLDTASSFLKPMLRFVEGAEPLQKILTWYVEAEWARHTGQLKRARDKLQLANDLLEFQTPDVSTLVPPLPMALSKVRLDAGEDLGGLPASQSEHPYWVMEQEVVSVRLALKQGNPEKAESSLLRLQELAKTVGSLRFQALGHLLKALVLEGRKDSANAVSALEQALLIGETNDYISLLFPYSQEIGALMERLSPGRISEEYLAHLNQSEYAPRIAGSQVVNNAETSPAATRNGAPVSAPPDFVEELSRRELEVLKELEEGHPNKVIAQKLSLSPATVKAHLRNINAKLGARNRTEALSLARKWGMLPNSTTDTQDK